MHVPLMSNTAETGVVVAHRRWATGVVVAVAIAGTLGIIAGFTLTITGATVSSSAMLTAGPALLAGSMVLLIVLSVVVQPSIDDGDNDDAT